MVWTRRRAFAAPYTKSRTRLWRTTGNGDADADADEDEDEHEIA